MLLLALSAFSALVGLVSKLYTLFWSPSARLQRIQLSLATRIQAMKDEKARLKATEDRIDKEPQKTGQDLIDDLNKKFPGSKP